MWCSDSGVGRFFDGKWWSYIYIWYLDRVIGMWFGLKVSYITVEELKCCFDGKYQRWWLRYWMSLRYWKELGSLHDTEIYVPSRDDNRLIGQSTVICTGRQIGDCDHWSTDWRLWPAVFWLETGTAPFLIGDRLGFPSHGVTREGNCPLILRGAQCQLIWNIYRARA